MEKKKEKKKTEGKQILITTVKKKKKKVKALSRVRPHELRPTRLLRPWDFPGKSTGVGCRCCLRVIESVTSKSSVVGKVIESGL